ncbi:MAG TPA: trigger factor, partial [Spirochaetia bacterium]|nr:trigger factor [Spirochaetia bacterium]
AEQEKLEATEDDVEKELARQAELRGSTLEEVRELFEKNNSIEYLRRDLADKKVFDLLLANSKITKGEKTTYVDLASKNQ